MVHQMKIGRRFKECTVWGLYYKTLPIPNLREMDRFRSKPITFGSEKYARTSLNKQTRYLTTKSIDCRSVMFLKYKSLYWWS
jgi:hypothetical protein